VAKTKRARKTKRKYERVPKTKRAQTTLVWLREKFGELPPSEMLDRLQNLRPGPRRKWDVHGLFDIFMCVEAIKARGAKPTEAWRQAAKFHRLTAKAVEHAWTEGHDRFAELFEGHESEILSRHVADRPRLKKFLAGIKTTPGT
jgi:hypothetical protein